MEQVKPLRVCRVCGIKAFDENDLEKFVSHKLSPYKKSNYCKDCRKIYARNWRRKNRDKIKAAKKRYSRKLRSRVINLLGNQCVCCGEKIPEFLTIDHINNDGHLDRKSLGTGGSRALYRKVLRELLNDINNPRERYRLLCYNCNLGRQRSGGICPHEEHGKN